MAGPVTDPSERLLRLVSAAEPRLRRALQNAIVAARRAPGTLAELAGLIESGQFELALDRATAAGLVGVTGETASTFVLAGERTSRFLSNALGIAVDFDQVNQRAVRTMQRERLRLIREFTEEQRAATRAALVDGAERGLNPVQQARNFRASIGLTLRQHQAVVRFRSLLESGSREALTRALRDRRFDRTVARAARTGEPLTAAQVNRMVDRYRQRYVAFRAVTIARTEALSAVHLANDEAYRQAVEQGHLAAEDLTRTWVTARDEKVRGSHRALNGVRKGLDEVFQGFAGVLRFPGDPLAPASERVRCRCALSTRIDAPEE